MNTQNWFFFFLHNLKRILLVSSDSALQHNWAKKAEIAFSISYFLYVAMR